jgi:hypothetical protein
MSNQIEAAEIEQFVAKEAKFGAASGVTVVVELEDGKVMTQRWGAVEATVETTPEPSEPTPETIREAWTKIATDEWQKFQTMAAEHGVHNMTRTAMVDTLADIGVMPGDDPSEDAHEQTVFNALQADGVVSKALATADD